MMSRANGPRKWLFISSVLSFSALAGHASYSAEIDAATMQREMATKLCPPEPATVRDLDMNAICGRAPDYADLAFTQCQTRVNNENQVIQQYNAFIYNCISLARRHNGQNSRTGSTGDPGRPRNQFFGRPATDLASRLGRAQEKAAGAAQQIERNKEQIRQDTQQAVRAEETKREDERAAVARLQEQVRQNQAKVRAQIEDEKNRLWLSLLHEGPTTVGCSSQTCYLSSEYASRYPALRGTCHTAYNRKTDTTGTLCLR